MSRPGRGSVRWRVQRWQELTLEQLYGILAARVQVFVVEQDCAYQELDGLDSLALHVTAWTQDHTPRVLAYARLNPPHSRFPEPSIGRVITAAQVRGTGMGRSLMARVLEQAEARYPGLPVRISAQQYLEGFYREFGFRTVSAPYLEDGLPHLEMLRPAMVSASPD